MNRFKKSFSLLLLSILLLQVGGLSAYLAMHKMVQLTKVEFCGVKAFKDKHIEIIELPIEQFVQAKINNKEFVLNGNYFDVVWKKYDYEKGNVRLYCINDGKESKIQKQLARKKTQEEQTNPHKKVGKNQIDWFVNRDDSHSGLLALSKNFGHFTHSFHLQTIVSPPAPPPDFS